MLSPSVYEADGGGMLAGEPLVSMNVRHVDERYLPAPYWMMAAGCAKQAMSGGAPPCDARAQHGLVAGPDDVGHDVDAGGRPRTAANAVGEVLALAAASTASGS